jgi:SAM-dependent methyltransferase
MTARKKRDRQPVLTVMPEIALDAVRDQREFYDARYDRGYMQDFRHVYEATRLRQVRAALRSLARSGFAPATALDYGCGEGRWFALLEETFPGVAITGCDISPRALELARAGSPSAQLALMEDERTDLAGGYDLLLSVEVLEHVGDVARACSELGRLLARGGRAVVTTPCANAGSLEWVISRLTGGLEATDDGYGRFALDEPSHLRRLRADDLCDLLRGEGLEIDRVLYSGHVFTALMAAVRGLRLPRLRAAVGMLDWHLLRRLPTGSTMIVIASRP